MPDNIPTFNYPVNRQNAPATCEHCAGILRHERWCRTRDPLVYYAYQIVSDPNKLTMGDILILHSLGVSWAAKGGVDQGQPVGSRPSRTQV
jgi:hypothetical protein